MKVTKIRPDIEDPLEPPEGSLNDFIVIQIDEGEVSYKSSLEDEKALFYIDKTKVSASKLESEILRKVGTDKKKTIVIRGHKDASYKNVMKVIDIANKNKLKMILAVKGR